MTEQAAEAPTRDALEALTREDIHEQYDVPLGKKDDMIDAVLNPAPTPPADDATVEVFIVNSTISQAFHYDQAADPVTADPTPVPAGQVDDIIAAAASGGVIIRKVEEA